MTHKDQNVTRILSCLTVLVSLLALSAPQQVTAESSLTPPALQGLWGAKRYFSPDVEGRLTIRERDSAYIATIAGYTVPVERHGSQFTLSIPGDRGRFVGDMAGGKIVGHWIQPRLVRMGLETASPVTLSSAGDGLWQGDVVVLDDTFTFFMPLKIRNDGKLTGFIRNPERNLGVFTRFDHVDLDGNTMRFVRENGELVFEGVYQPDWDRFTIDIPNRGGSYDFYRIDEDEGSAFYGRGRHPAPYVYRPPLKEGDGWSVGRLSEVGISLGPIREMIEKEIDPPATSVEAQYIHGLLIARHGKLVFEDYFYGWHSAIPHDSRSASKSLTAVLTGAVIEAGYDLSPSTGVYSAVYQGKLPDGLDPLKQKITLENLLTMSSGFYCDDSDPDAPGNEDVMQSQEEENDWYKYTLELPMALAPGEEAIYCSVNPNLIGKVLEATTGKPLEVLFQELIADPLQIDQYHLILQPTGEPYMGGGIHWLPRDFMKLGQLMLNGGMWNGKRVISEEWAKRSSSPLYDIRERQYGYLWWVEDYPYLDGKVRAYFAGGNGGQTVLVIPELDLVVEFWGGNYSSRTLYRIYEVMIPDYILKAVEKS